MKISKILVENKKRHPLSLIDKAIYVVDIPKVSKLIKEELNYHKMFQDWCIQTDRVGHVLVNKAIKEFLDYLTLKIE